MNLIRALESASILNACRLQFRLFPVWYFALGCLLLTSCNSNKYLKEDQSFLRKNLIKIQSKHKIDDKAELKEELSQLYRQPATRGIIPRHYFYYQYQNRLRRDSIKRLEYINKGLEPPKGIKRWSDEKLIRNRPVIYDSVKAVQTTEAFERHLNLRGYRAAEATFREKTNDKETYVYYKVDPGPRIYIDTFIIATNDSSLQAIVSARKDDTHFSEGSPLDVKLYEQETERIVEDFQNRGYALFDETHIAPLEVDTAGQYVKATMRILDQNDSTFHKRYYVGDITIYPRYDLTDTSALHDTIVRGVKYVIPSPRMTIKPEAIERNLFLHKGDLTRLENLNQTLKNLSRMELIRFVTPVTEVDTIANDTPRINYTLLLNRNKKIALNSFVELTYANINTNTVGTSSKYLLGTSASLNYRDRNLLKGAEILNLGLEYGVEFNFFNKSSTGNRNAINSENLSAGTDISLPRFVDPLGIYRLIGYQKGMDQPGLVKNRLRRWLLFDANTRMDLNYNRVDIRELYKYYSVNAQMSYDVVPDNYRHLRIDRIGVDLYVPTPTDSFRLKVLDRSRLLKESFGKYLFTGLLFRKYTYELIAPPRNKSSYVSLLHGVEISGLEVYLLNKLFDKEFVLGSSNSTNGESQAVEFSHFAKAEIETRFYYNFSSSTQFAFKFNTGLATPFGSYSQQVPYIKQFFVGGPLSNRAWQIRQLGPGSYRDPTDVERFNFYQTGDIKIDMSAEFRFPLFWYFDGAVFVDAANVWTLKYDSSREGSQFKFDRFYKEFGIGYGFGIRLDLDFFILRLDIGYKWHSPFDIPERESKYYPLKFPEGGVPQIAVGLPF